MSLQEKSPCNNETLQEQTVSVPDEDLNTTTREVIDKTATLLIMFKVTEVVDGVVFAEPILIVEPNVMVMPCGFV